MVGCGVSFKYLKRGLGTLCTLYMSSGGVFGESIFMHKELKYDVTTFIYITFIILGGKALATAALIQGCRCMSSCVVLGKSVFVHEGVGVLVII